MGSIKQKSNCRSGKQYFQLCIYTVLDKKLLWQAEQKMVKTTYVVSRSHCSPTILAVPSSLLYTPSFSLCSSINREFWEGVLLVCFPTYAFVTWRLCRMAVECLQQYCKNTLSVLKTARVSSKAWTKVQETDLSKKRICGYSLVSEVRRSLICAVWHSPYCITRQF